MMEAVKQKSKLHKSRTSRTKRKHEANVEDITSNISEEIFEDALDEAPVSIPEVVAESLTGAANISPEEVVPQPIQATAPELSSEQILEKKPASQLLIQDAMYDLCARPIHVQAPYVPESTIYPRSLLNDVIQATRQMTLQVGPTEMPKEDIVEPKTEYKNLYPVLKSIEAEILDYRAVITSHKERYVYRTNVLACKELENFNKDVTALEGHEFFLLMVDFESSRNKLVKAQLKATILQRNMKNLEFELWKERIEETKSVGKCDDGNSVSVSKKYSVMDFIKENESQIIQNLQELKDSILPLLAFEKYNVHYLKLKIDIYIYLLVESTKPYNESMLPYTLFTSLTTSTPKIETIRICLSILFYFQRKPTGDAEFIQVGRKWITDLVTYLFVNGSDSDRMFVLNHVLRCPADVKSWATRLIQFPALLKMTSYSSDVEQSGFQYALTSLMIVLCPVPDRDNFLKEIRKCYFHEEPCPPDCGFTLLSEDGEEVDELKFRKVWYDSDVLSILQQIPLLKMLESSLNISTEERKSYTDVNEVQVQRLIALSSFLLDLLFVGFKTYSPSVYINSSKAIGNLISSTLNYLSDFWAKYKMHHPVFNCCLQVEMDRMIFQCVHNLLRTRCMLELLLNCSFDLVSSKMLWNLLWLFHSDPNLDENELFSAKDVEFKLKDEAIRLLLRDNLASFPQSDKVHILQALKQMSLSRCGEKEYKFCMALEMFEIFCDERHSSLTEHFSLISTIADQDPTVISFLLKYISASDADNILKCANSLFNVLYLGKWIPSMPEDLDILSVMLLSKSIETQHNQLSRLILKKLNWGFKDGVLALPIEFHRYVGMVVVKAFLKHQADGDSTGIKQMLQIYTSGLFLNSDSNKSFVSWGWQLLFTLKLHVLSYPRPSWIKIFDGNADNVEIPHVHMDPSLLTLRSAYQQNNPAACYLVIAMTKTGHMVKYLSSEGITIISTLVDSKQYAPAVQCLYFILPFFTKNQELLLSNEKFLTSFASLLTADQVSYKNGSAVVGSVLSKIRDMMKIQLYEAGKVLIECVSPILKLYVQLLVKILLMEAKGRLKLNTAVNQIYYFLDLVIKIAFLHSHTLDDVLELLSEITRPLLHDFEIKKQSSWLFFGGTEKLSPLLPQPSSDFTFYAFSIILTEGNQKVMQDIWFSVQNEMTVNSSVAPEPAFKKVVSCIGLPTIPLQVLPIYRWATLALIAPLDHPMLPLIWQQFFLRYLQRTSNISGTMTGCSLGKRFFESSSSQGLLDKLKLRLKETCDFYNKKVENAKAKAPTANQASSASKRPVQSEELSLLVLFQGFHTWINSPVAHGTVCFADLAPSFNPPLFELIYKNDQSLWFQYVFLDKVKEEAQPESDLWTPTENMHPKVEPQIASVAHSENTPEALPVVKHHESPLAVINADVWSTTSSWLNKNLERCQASIYNETVKFDHKLSKLKNLDERYKNQLPREYTAIEEKHVLAKPCRLHTKCSGPAHFTLKVPKFTRNADVQGRINRNRSEYENLLSQVLNAHSEELCNATLEMEVILRKLVYGLKVNTDGRKAKELKTVCTDLFYNLFDRIEKVFSAKDNSFSCYSPTSQFFATCIEILGKEIALDHKEHCHNLLVHLLKSPLASQLISSYFCPNQLPEPSFVTVYKTLVESMPSHSASALFVFFSKVKLAKWLSASKASFSCRKALLQLSGQALAHCGPEPSKESLALYEIIKKHFRNLFLHDFPELFPEAIQVLLKVMDEGSLNVDIWYEVFNHLGCSVKTDEKDDAEIKAAIAKFAQNRSLPPNEKLFISCPTLHLDQVFETLDHFHDFFEKIRVKSGEHLYRRFKLYLKEIGIFLAMMGHSLLEMKDDKSMIRRNKDRLSKIEFLWMQLHRSFQPWIDPCTKVLSNKVEFPWTCDELPESHAMFKMFSLCIGALHQEHSKETDEKSLLSLAWNYYVQTYIEGNKRDYFIIVCHTAFLEFPWETFHPSVCDVSTMFQVLKSPVSESQLFVIEISLRVQWLDVVSGVLTNSAPEYKKHWLAYVARFFVSSSWVHLTTKTANHQKVLKDLEKLPWHFIEPQTVLEFFCMYAAFSMPKNLIQSSTVDSCDVYVLDFLKVVSGFIPRSEMADSSSIHSDAHVERKRQIYLGSVMDIYAKCFTHHQPIVEKSIETYAQIIPKHLSEIQSIVWKDFGPSDQMARSSVLVKEVLCLLNMIDHQEISDKILRATVSWLKENSKSPLLLPCIQIACTSLTKVSILVPIIECCITARYKTELQDPSEAADIWNILSSCLHLPAEKHDELIKFCIEQNACFCLYKYVMQRLCSSSNNQGKVLLFRKMIGWLDAMKPSENAEPKMLLLWDQILQLSFTVINEEDLHTAECGLLQFSTNLIKLADEGSGLLSFMGLGKSATYSVNFRFLCRALAAYIFTQLPDNGSIRLMPSAAGHWKPHPNSQEEKKTRENQNSEPSPSTNALKTFEELKQLTQKKPYAALKSQIEKSLSYLSDPRYCFLESRTVLKELVLQVFPNQSYLHLLGS